METDQEGFWYPEVDYSQCIECGMCIRVCPIIQIPKKEHDEQVASLAYAAYNKDESVRLDSSSGGLFTLIAEEVIGAGGVVFGARFDDEFNVIHDHAESLDALGAFRGSKYVQSNIGTSYKKARKFLQEGRLVLFTGTPCQIGGLKYYLGRDYDNLLCQDIVCHGVPSPEVWQKYVSYREERASAPAQRISFRRKKEGWKKYSVSFSFQNNTEYVQIHNKDLYIQAFLKDICLRPSCHACHFKTINRDSDLTLADFWGIQNIAPELDDDKGTSFVIVHSEKGHKLLERIQDQIVKQEVDLWHGVKHNSAMVKSAVKHPKRDEFFTALDHEDIDSLITRLCRDKLTVRIRRKLISGTRFVLEKLGLLETAKRILSRNSTA
jgi:coenzyme F420-reducing hydrogenase beta subunit